MSKPVIEIFISPNQMKGYLTIHAEARSSQEESSLPPTEDDLLQELRAHHITFGIRREALQAIASGRGHGERMLVACGVEPIPGESGRIEYFFDTTDDPRPRPLEDGRVDYREIGIVHVVEQEALLARLIPPTAGVPGTTILGAEVPARYGESAHIKAGKFTYFCDKNPPELRAQVSGSVSLVRGAVQVERTYLVRGNVDFSTGNIDFPGDLVISGDVKSGFRIHAGGKIEIRGVVEDAVVEADSDVLVKGGFEGTGRGLIRAKGSVHLKFIENQSLEAGGAVHIGETALHARILSDDFIYLTTGKGAIIGGYAQARKGLKAKILGNANQLFTTVDVLEDHPVHPELENQKKTVLAYQAELKRLDLSWTKLKELNSLDVTCSDEVKAGQLKLQKKLQASKSKMETARRELEELQSHWDRDETGKIIILRKIHPGTRAIIHGLEYLFKVEAGELSLSRDDLLRLARPESKSESDLLALDTAVS